MREADVLSDAIKKAQKNGYDLQNAKLGAYYIFTHEFAKAFWGEEDYFGMAVRDFPAWRYHLQMMVQEENPIRYLEKFL